MDSSGNGKVILTSFLQKRSKIFHFWRSRFCVLTERYIFTYKGTEKNSESTSFINLTECIRVNSADQYLGKQNTFELANRNRSYFFMCKNRDEQEEWIEALEQIIEMNLEEQDKEKEDKDKVKDKDKDKDKEDKNKEKEDKNKDKENKDKEKEDKNKDIENKDKNNINNINLEDES